MMQQSNKWDNETRALFDTLPKLVQESVMQSGVRIESAAQLKSLAEKLMREHKAD